MPENASLMPQFRPTPASSRTWTALGDATAVTLLRGGVRLSVGSATLEVTAVADGVFRVAAFADGRPVDYASEAVAAPHDDEPDARVERLERAVIIRASWGAARVDLYPTRVGFVDADGRPFCQDDPSLGAGHLMLPRDAGAPDLLAPPARVHKRRPSTERYFGCGERTGGLEKTFTRQVFWNVDPPDQHTESLNNLYTSIPFVLALDGGRAWGLFVDNAGRVELDLGARRPDVLTAATDCGDLVYYVFAGPSPRDVLERYTRLTGRTPMPPLWALGNHQSRWGYKSDEEIRGLARQFRERDIPCDALYLDIDYMDQFRVFTWDASRFPDPKKLTSDLAAQGIRVVTIVDPGLKVDESYEAYVTARDRGFFCKTIAGAEYRNVVWPGVCAFPDFTLEEARAWWGERLAALVDEGVAGIWCDMNEPSLFIPAASTMPDNVVHAGPRPRLHVQVHNAYGSLMAEATRAGLRELLPDRRPFVISRAGYAGLQRHALHWTGDNWSWWEHAAMCLPQVQNLGLSGLAWVGVDVGGFWGNSNGELLTRWTESAIFFPFYRNHCSRDSHPQEPWAFGEPWESHLRALLKLRQRLLPLLYSLFEECHRSGAPIVRPLLFEFPEDATTYAVDTQFLVGRALLVAPITRPGIEHRAAYLPAGVWVHWWTGEKTRGPAHVLAHAPVARPAFWARANVAVPMWPEMSHVDQRPRDPLTLVLHVDEGVDEATLYEDAGDGWGHERGVFARRMIRCACEGRRVVVDVGPREGSFEPVRERVVVELRGLPEGTWDVRVGGRSYRESATGGIVRVMVPEEARAIRIEAEWLARA
jgi:alpha-glucosidase